MNNIGLGFKHVFTGILIFKENKSYRKYLYAPALISLLLFLSIFGYALAVVPEMVTENLSSFGLSEGIFKFIYYPVLIVSWLVLGTSFSLLSFFIYILIASPFISLISEKIIYPEQTPAFSFKFFIKMLKASVLKIIIFSFFGILIFILSFIPIINIFSYLFTALLFTFDSFDYGFETRGLKLGERFSFIGRHADYFLGASAAYMIILAIPALNIILLCASVAGNSMFIKEQYHEPRINP